jgi:hypothetical protein
MLMEIFDVSGFHADALNHSSAIVDIASTESFKSSAKGRIVYTADLKAPPRVLARIRVAVDLHVGSPPASP